MSLTAYLQGRLESKKVLLMTHVIVGYPSLEINWKMLEIMAEVGVDVVELQMPFSEPVADGPTFVRANQLALEGGLKLEDYFDFFGRSAAQFDFPHLMMGYYNTVFQLGHEAYCEQLKACGASGFILPDLPFEEYGNLFQLSEESGLEPILLMTPTNTDDRLEAIGQRAHGFVYTVARKGVTGSSTEFDQNVGSLVERCRRATDLPLALGFGLRRGEDLRQLQGMVEMGIVGSALFDAWEAGGEAGYGAFLQELSQGRD